MTSMPGPEGALPQACLESATDLVIAGPEADAGASRWRERHGRLARLTGTRLVLLPGLARAAPTEQASAALEVARALLDPGQRCPAICGAGVHFVSPDDLAADHVEEGEAQGEPAEVTLLWSKL